MTLNLRRGSNDEQAEAEVCRVEVGEGEVAVELGPPAGAEVAEVAFRFKQWGGRPPKAGGRELAGRTWDEMPLPLAA
jgi:hypothetical protein